WMMRRSGPGLSLWARSRAVRFGMRVSYPQLKRRPAIWPMASLGCIPGVHQGYTKRPVTPCCAVLATQRNASTNPLSLLGFSWNFVLRPVAWCNPSAALGLGKVYSGMEGAAALRRYLEQPLTIYLGQGDTRDDTRNDYPEALAQGASRYQRGLNVFNAAKTLAQARGWKFDWRL